MLYDRIRLLASEAGKSLNQIDRELGYSRNTLANYKKQQPSVRRLDELAKYFHVSTDYLLGKSESRDQESLNQLITLLNNSNQKTIMVLAQRLLTEQNKSEKANEPATHVS